MEIAAIHGGCGIEGVSIMSGFSRRALVQGSLGGATIALTGAARATTIHRAGEEEAGTAVRRYLRGRARAGTPGAVVSLPGVGAHVSRFEKDRAAKVRGLGSQSAWNGRMHTMSSDVRQFDVVHHEGSLYTVRALEVVAVDWEPAPQDRSAEYATAEAAEPERFGLGAQAPTRVVSSAEVLHELGVDLGPSGATIVTDAYGDWLFSGLVSPDVADSPFMTEYLATVRGPDHNGETQRRTSMPQVDKRKYAATYNWQESSNYAQNWALGQNNNYVNYICQGVDCANFASQCLWRGGEAPSGIWNRVAGTNCGVYGWGKGPYAWVNNQGLRDFIRGYYRGDAAGGVGGTGLGDLINYNWDGAGGTDHVSIVSVVSATGRRLVCAHTSAVRNVPWELGGASSYTFTHLRQSYWV